MPYAQIRERGFEAHEDGTPLTSIDIELEAEMPTVEMLALLPDEPVRTTGSRGFDIDDEEYADIVGRIIDDEIGNGEGANLVIGRTYSATDRRLGRARRADGVSPPARA